MKTTINRNHLPVRERSSCRALLRGMEADVQQCRSSFLAQLQTLPRPFARALQKNYADRLDRGQGKPMLGEYAPWLLADMLPVKSRLSINRVLSPWMNLYSYSLFVDDILDVENKVDAAPLLIASELLLQRGISQLFERLPSGAHVRVRIDKYFQESAEAVFREITRHRKKLRSYDSREVDRVGEKVSLLKLCASCLLLSDNHREPDEELLIPVGLLATGIQMLDDVSDWKEDWKAGNMTPLLTNTLSRMRRSKIIGSHFSKLSLPDVFTGMVVSGALEAYLNRGLTHLQQVCASPNLKKGSRTHRLLSQIIVEHRELLEEVRQVRHQWLRFNRERSFSYADFRLTKAGRTRLPIIQKKISIVAQST